MKVLVTGSRSWVDEKTIHAVLLALPLKPTLIIQGGAHGADEFAKEWAAKNGIACHTEPANWNEGRKAGPIRNQTMVDMKPDLVVAFTVNSLSQSVGTFDCVHRAQRAGIPVYLVSNGCEEGYL